MRNDEAVVQGLVPCWRAEAGDKPPPYEKNCAVGVRDDPDYEMMPADGQRVVNVAQQKVHVVLWQDGDQWVAWCLEYDVASQGDSEQHALAMIREAVELHVEDMTSEELERALIPVESTPIVREMTIRAPAILKR